MPYVGSPAQKAAQRENIKKALARRHKYVSDAEYITRIKARCKVTARSCWEFQGFCNWQGYGEISYRGQAYRVHRLMYILTKGPVSADLAVCHSCDNPRCCNPEHLWIGTKGDNLRDMAAKGRHQEQVKTRCPRGHLYDAENTYRTPSGARNCKACCRGRNRVKAGWPEDLAYSTPTVPANARTERRTFGKRLHHQPAGDRNG